MHEQAEMLLVIGSLTGICRMFAVDNVDEPRCSCSLNKWQQGDIAKKYWQTPRSIMTVPVATTIARFTITHISSDVTVTACLGDAMLCSAIMAARIYPSLRNFCFHPSAVASSYQ